MLKKENQFTCNQTREMCRKLHFLMKKVFHGKSFSIENILHPTKQGLDSITIPSTNATEFQMEVDAD